MTAKHCSFFATITDVKDSRGARFVLVNAGLQHMLRPALIGNHAVRFYNPEGRLLHPDGEGSGYVVGNTCHPLDNFTPLIPTPSSPPNDLIGGTVEILCTGAYCQCFAAHGFSLNELAGTLYINGGYIRT